MTWTAPHKVSVMTGPAHYREPALVRDLVAQTLAALDLPADFVQPGNRVVLKPNWVKEHDERHPGPNQWEHVVTHPTVIEAVTRWAAQELRGRGSITICDAPQTDSSFAKLSEYCGLADLVARCRKDFPGIEIALLDLRPEEWHAIDGVTVSKTKLPGDPLGSTQVRLDAASEFVGYPGCGRLYGASFDMAETNARHTGARHEYLLCRTPMEADVLINLPKLKTHKKVGVTCALKNLVGINANKNWLPHHTEGTPDRGGDQFPVATTKARLEHSWMGAAKRWLKNRPALSRLFVPLKKAGRVFFGDTQKVVRSGNWHGNDTCWRMVLDLNKCLFFFDGAGERRGKPLRYLAVVDGIIGGEGNGPMSPDPKPCGVVLAGTHPTAVDTVAAALMGFDWQKLRLLKNSFAMRELSFVPFQPGDIEVVSDKAAWSGKLDRMEETFSFLPHFGWVGALETDRGAPASGTAAEPTGPRRRRRIFSGSMDRRPTLQQVREFWNTAPCGAHFVRQFSSERDFYEKFREYRYRTEWHIPVLVPFASARGKRVLEIGTGHGADGAMFALHGGIYTGVDLTDAAVEATRKHFQSLGLNGTFLKQNAERIDLAEGSFDIVYSHGVLHHTPNPQAALDEVWRVLKPGGQAIIMLYHKRSFNYLVRIMTYMRLRVVLKVLARLGRWEDDRQRALSEKLTGLRGNQDQQVWEIHYANFLKEGWGYLAARRFVHHGTDGPECPIAFAFNRSEARQLFAKFRDVKMTVAHLPLRRYCRWIPFAVEKSLAPRLGWYLFIFATK